jgi:predicted ATPase
MLPYGLNPQFLERSKEVSQVRMTLDPSSKVDEDELKVMAIHGLGGVGKSQVALHYANMSMKLFEVIVWIPSETHVKMSQAIANFASKLGLPRNDTDAEEEDMQIVTKVKDWLNSSGRSFLLIFDNVEDIDVVLAVWPSSTRGSILITTRSSSIASKRTSNILHLKSFIPEAGETALSTLAGLPAEAKAEVAALSTICQLLGGLPLAIVQISQFIRERGYNYEEFLKLYEKSATKIHARGETPQEYSHTLSTVWAMSLEKLTPEAEHLLSLLAFFDPDLIFERHLTNPRLSLTDDCLQFLFDDFEYVVLPESHYGIHAC